MYKYENCPECDNSFSTENVELDTPFECPHCHVAVILEEYWDSDEETFSEHLKVVED